MGKPFEQEIDKSISTYRWASQQSVDELSSYILKNRNVPLFVVGSGGSLSACHFASYLYQKLGVMAKAITPLEIFYCQEAMRGSKVLFISASGKNSDIIFGFKTVVANEPMSLINLCMKYNTKLSMLSRRYSGVAKTFEYNLPSGKDGFLATNSLVAYFGILLKAFGHLTDSEVIDIPSSFKENLDEFLKKIHKEYSYMVLYGGLGQPVAMDLESKFVESAVGDISTSDYRNFAHGRHHWFAKRGSNSAIIAIITPAEQKLAEKTLSLLPKSIPVLLIKSKYTTPFASLDLLVKSFHFVNRVGKMQKIDPGRPGVPGYGSKLYNLKYSKALQGPKNHVDTIILRKANCKSINELSSSEYKYWRGAYKNVLNNLNKTKFGALVFDYDGTLCSSDNRFNGITTEVANELKRILKDGFLVGIATGRGKSVREVFQKVLPKRFWKNFIIGYYNGSDIALLDDDKKPETKKSLSKNLQELYKTFSESDFPIKFKSDLRPNQLTIELHDSENWNRIKPFILQTVKIAGYQDVELLESTHSIDIVSKPLASKLHLISFCKDLLRKKSLPQNVLTIGDKGQWPGNDYELLSHPYSLSVDEVSPLPNGAWNLSQPGVKNINALIAYLKCIEVHKKVLKIRIK